jgi:hypothetical protein
MIWLVFCCQFSYQLISVEVTPIIDPFLTNQEVHVVIEILREKAEAVEVRVVKLVAFYTNH